MYQVLCMFSSDMLDAQVVNDQPENGWALFLFPESWCVATLEVSFCFQSVSYYIVGYDACLWKAIHSPVNPTIHIHIVLIYVQVIIFHNFICY